MDNRDDEEIQPYQFEPEWSPGELDTPEYSDNDTDTSDSSSDLEGIKSCGPLPMWARHVGPSATPPVRSAPPCSSGDRGPH